MRRPSISCLQTLSLSLLIAVTLLFGICTAGSDSNDSYASNESRLYKFLMDGYRPSIRPVIHENDSITVRISLVMVTIDDLDEKQQTFIFSGLINYHWKDAILVWDPKNFGGVTEIRIPIVELWYPDIMIYNRILHPEFRNDFRIATACPNNLLHYNAKTCLSGSRKTARKGNSSRKITRRKDFSPDFEKMEEAYELLLTELLSIEPRLQPSVVMLDFENTAMNAFVTKFGCELHGCHFYFVQCLRRKVQEHGYATNYNTGEDFAHHIHIMLVALLYIRNSDKDSAFDRLIHLDTFSDVETLARYFQETFLGKKGGRLSFKRNMLAF